MKRKNPGKSRGGPGRPPAEEAAKLQDRLLDAALELFNAQGYGKTSMEQIARHAGASTKTLYARFADKPAVVEAVVDRLVDANLAEVESTVSDQDPRAFLIAMGTKIAVTLGGSAAGLIHIALSEGRHFPAIRQGYNATLARGRKTFRQALEGWQKAGLLPDLKDPEMAATLLVSMLTDMVRIRSAMGDPMSRQETAAYIPYAADFFLRGCGYRARP